MSKDDILIGEAIKKYFPVRGGIFNRIIGWVKAVDDVDIYIKRGETFGLVGESGSGKSTLARVLLRLIEPTSGKIIFDGIEITSLSRSKLKSLRKRMQIVFQDPYTSLHPRKKIYEIVGEPLEIHEKLPKYKIRERVSEILTKVGLHPEHMYRYPHEFSGGQRQRIMIARALITNPELLVLDEPTSALDVSVQARILNLLLDLKQEYKLTYILISHNLSIVDYMSDRIGVMYLGKLVEVAPRDELINNPLHPYTRLLLSSIPIPDPKIARSKQKIRIKGEPPSSLNPPRGCRFSTRCPYAKSKCTLDAPKLEEAMKEHYVACFYWEDIRDREPWKPLKIL